MFNVIIFISLLKNAVKSSSIGRGCCVFITLEASEPIGKEKDHGAVKYGKASRKQPKREQKGPLLAWDDACLLVSSASA
jgi:hypothetical protein